MTARETLASQIEAADAGEQRAMLEEAFAYIHKMDDGLAPADWSALNWPFADRFTAMLDAEAYESAAMMLVPDGWCITAFEWWPMTSTKAGVTLREVRENEWGIGFDQTCGDARSHAATPALALSAAAVRAGGE